MKIEKIITDRLVIREFTSNDAEFAFSIWNNP